VFFVVCESPDYGLSSSICLFNLQSQFFYSDGYDYTKFNTFENIEKELHKIVEEYSDIARLDVMGKFSHF